MMKRLTLTIVMLLLAVPLNAQTVDLTDGSTVEVEQSVKSHHEVTLEKVRKAIDESDLGPLRKKILQRKLNREVVALQVTDYVTSNAINQGVVEVPLPPSFVMENDVQEVQMEIDLDGLLAFIERLLPLIIQLIGLFGGWVLVSGNGLTSLWGKFKL